MTDYKHTLNLPVTAFPMKASLATREPQRLKAWQDAQIYQQIRAAREGSPRFVLHDGPPYANGHLHCGHALNKILKDMILKSKTLSGFDAPLVPGWDCHGLPIELNVEKKIGKAGVKVNNKAFRQHCRDYASSQIDIQRDEFERLGVFADWQNPYTTMQPAYEANVVRALAHILANGHVQRGFKPVHWCIDCGSALAEAEVDYEEKLSYSIDVAFYAETPAEFLARCASAAEVKQLVVPIWTTTPWTLPANEAVALHPDIDYALVETERELFLIAQNLVTAVMARFNITAFQLIQTCKGHVFEHLRLQHPLYTKTVPIVLSTHVTTESGTGCVHIAPAHGPDDYSVGLKYALPCVNPVMGSGCYTESVEQFAGMHVRKVDALIIQALSEHGVLLHQAQLQHSYPHCWRHKTPVIFRATPQWFISMDQNGLRASLLKNIDEVVWLPQWGQARIAGMVSDRPDWCISRQRVWGTPMCLFVHKSTQALHPNTVDLLQKIANKIEQHGLEAWYELDVSELLGPDAADYEPITDTLDVWFDSGVSHFSVLHWGLPGGSPADVYFEGSDQHRGWFNSSLTTSVAMHGKAPYKKVLTHGYTVDADGRKLSKSRGNYVALDEVIRQHGADILRLWVASTDYRNEVSISEEILKRTGDAYRRIRNTARFLLSNLFDFDANKIALKADELVELDRWVLKRAQLLQHEIIEAYAQFQFHVVYQKIHHFCAVDLSSFYLDIIKDRQYTTPVDSVARRSCQIAMYHLLQALVRWMAPILSFTADEIWEFIPQANKGSLFTETWYTDWPSLADVDMHAWDVVYRVRNEVNKALEVARQAGIIGSGLEAAVTVYANPAVLACLTPLKDELRFVLITSQAEVLPENSRPTEVVFDEATGVGIAIHALSHAKCVRCWHRVEEIGLDATHPELCPRCVGNITYTPEVRVFA